MRSRALTANWFQIVECRALPSLTGWTTRSRRRGRAADAEPLLHWRQHIVITKRWCREGAAGSIEPSIFLPLPRDLALLRKAGGTEKRTGMVGMALIESNAKRGS